MPKELTAIYQDMWKLHERIQERGEDNEWKSGFLDGLEEAIHVIHDAIVERRRERGHPNPEWNGEVE